MKLEQRLEAYINALKDWKAPMESMEKITDDMQGKHYPTEWGFCWYFNAYVRLEECFFYDLDELISQRITGDRNEWHYTDKGSTESGRKQRVNALKEAIILTKLKLEES